MNKKDIQNIFALTVIGAFFYVFSVFVEVIQNIIEFLTENPAIPIVIFAIIGCCIFFHLNQKRKLRLYEERRRKAALEARERREEYIKGEKAKLIKEINKVIISDKREDYTFHREDYKRGNKRENEYRRLFLLQLLNLYENKCAKCGDAKGGFDLDHFVFSKNEGGNFALLHKDGYWVNNAIPLCKKCNRSKGDRSYRDFFSESELLFCFAKNKEMTLKLNEEA